MPPLELIEPITDISQAPLSLGDVTFSKGMGDPLTPLKSAALVARPSWWKEGDWELKAVLKFEDNEAALEVPFRAAADLEDIPFDQPLTLGALLNTQPGQDPRSLAVARIFAEDAQLNIKTKGGGREARFELTVGEFCTFVDVPFSILGRWFPIM